MDFFAFASQNARSEFRGVTNMIRRITDAEIRHYDDNGQTIAYVSWIDSRSERGTTQGNPDNLHMQALLQRAEREGVTIRESR